MTSLAQELAAQHAPLVRLHRSEVLLPTAADEFIQRCALQWADGSDQGLPVAGAVDPARLGSTTSPYGFPGASAGAPQLGEIACTAHTRPHDKRPADFALPDEDGFTLCLNQPSDVVGNANQSTNDTYSGAPAYFDYQPGRLGFWFFYAGSGLPAVISHRLWLHEQKGLLEPVDDISEATAREALARSHPELYATVEERASDAIWQSIWEKLRTLVVALGSETYLCHEGDWERVTLFLDPKDARNAPLSAAFDAHGQPRIIPWSEAEQEEGRLVVYSARGSHASLTSPRSLSTGDIGDEEGRRWRTWERLESITQPWWGFGGAWGRAGAVGDLTGPLGPSPYKPAPTP